MHTQDMSLKDAQLNYSFIQPAHNVKSLKKKGHMYKKRQLTAEHYRNRLKSVLSTETRTRHYDYDNNNWLFTKFKLPNLIKRHVKFTPKNYLCMLGLPILLT